MRATELDATQLRNARLVDDALKAIGLTNPFLRAGILAVVAKESGFKPKSEIGYSTTSARRIREIFGSWFRNMSDTQIDQLKRDDRAFFNHVYSNNTRLGNKGGDDGYNFRGRGPNQLTGRANYEDMARKLSIDLVNNPDLVNDPEAGARICARFFRDSIVRAQASGVFRKRHNITRTAEIKNVIQGALVAHDTNGGFGIWPTNDPTGGWQTVSGSAQSYYDWLVRENRL